MTLEHRSKLIQKIIKGMDIFKNYRYTMEIEPYIDKLNKLNQEEDLENELSWS